MSEKWKGGNISFWHTNRKQLRNISNSRSTFSEKEHLSSILSIIFYRSGAVIGSEWLCKPFIVQIFSMPYSHNSSKKNFKVWFRSFTDKIVTSSSDTKQQNLHVSHIFITSLMFGVRMLRYLISILWRVLGHISVDIWKQFPIALRILKWIIKSF